MTAFINLAYLVTRHELPKLSPAAFADGGTLTTTQIAAHITAAK